MVMSVRNLQRLLLVPTQVSGPVIKASSRIVPIQCLHSRNITSVPTSVNTGRLRGRISVISPSVMAIRGRSAVATATTTRQKDKEIQDITMEEEILQVTWQDGHKSKYHTTWLRDNCNCQYCCHPDSKQKLICVADLPEKCTFSDTPVINNDSMTVQWLENGKMHVSQYKLDWLRSHCRSVRCRPMDKESSVNQVLWDSTLPKDSLDVDYNKYMNQDSVLCKSLENLRRYGFFFVRNIPDAKPDVKACVEQIAQRIGPLRNTFYGLTWEVAFQPNPTNIASSSIPLPLHQDLQYFECPPAVQLLHCLKAAPGGVTELADGFSVAEKLRKKEPEAFQILSQLPLSYHYRSSSEQRTCKHTLISLDAQGQIDKLHYSPPWEAPLDLPVEQMGDFYKAHRLFSSMCRAPESQIVKRMEPGDCVVLNNNRVFHARTKFDETCERLLKGCYVDRDDFYSRLA
eukprot:Ihof_evm5s81 gene=Ihof_evmTU5s81